MKSLQVVIVMNAPVKTDPTFGSLHPVEAVPGTKACFSAHCGCPAVCDPLESGHVPGFGNRQPSTAQTTGTKQGWTWRGGSPGMLLQSHIAFARSPNIPERTIPPLDLEKGLSR
ncbi:MAG: hypothetical protein KKD25_11725 [Gammaproteobacteria bacterium]|nr:hypothetical protein [Gammaproteobacteria bacterium]MBU0770565.1 hypothetical protein [Gammaproteobacteria bacterium]MBU0857522.1 hypothetical protein [Gammaproteobacteria bacterium]MBU1845186.1 hypothetical protein [Gammaproteobacteria bacterium]